MSAVLLLDNNYQPINLISIRKALKLIVKEKVEVVKSDTKKLHNHYTIPKVVRLLKSIANLYKRQIPWTKQNVFTRDEFVCQYCGAQLQRSTSTIDHVHPVSKGGKNSWENTVTACKPCNNWKGDKLLEETNMTLMKKPRKPTLLDFFTLKFKNYDLSGIWENN